MIYALLETEGIGRVDVIRASTDKKALKNFAENFNINDWVVAETGIYDVENKFLHIIHYGQDLEDFQYWPIAYYGTLAYTYESLRKIRLHFSSYVSAKAVGNNMAEITAIENIRKIFPGFLSMTLEDALSVYFSYELLQLTPGNELMSTDPEDIL